MRATTSIAVLGIALLLSFVGSAAAQQTRPATATAAAATQPLALEWDSPQPDVRSLSLPAFDAVFSGDDKRLTVAGSSIFQLDVRGARELWRTEIGAYSYGRRIALSPDGKRLAVSHSTGVAILDAGTGAVLINLVHENPGHQKNPKVAQFLGMMPVAFSPDGKTVASSSIYAPQVGICLWDAMGGKLLRTLSDFGDNGSHNVFDLAFSPDGLSLATVEGYYSQERARSEGGKLRVWDVATGTVRRTYGGAIFCSWAVGFNPDGKLLATGSGLYGRHDPPRGEVRVWEAATGRAVYTGNRQQCVYRVKFSPDGRRLVSGGGDRTTSDTELTLTDTSTWLDEPSLAGRIGAIHGLNFSRDGRMLASTSPPGRAAMLRIWNLPPAPTPRIEPPGDIPTLIHQLGENDFRARLTAVRQLKALGKAAHAALREARDSRDPEVRVRAEEILADYAPAYPNTMVHTVGVVAYWRFSGPSPARSLVGGYTGSFVNATLNSALGNAPTRDNDSKKALWLDGNKSGFSTSLAAQQTFKDGATLMCWICFDTTPAKAGRIFTIMSKGEFQKDLDLQAEPDGKIHFYTDTGSSTSFAPPSFAGWHHLAATFDSLSQRRCIYWDGKSVAEDPQTPAHVPSPSPLTIGQSAAFPGRFFQGALDEVALFNRALSAQEIAALYAAVSEPPALGRDPAR